MMNHRARKKSFCIYALIIGILSMSPVLQVHSQYLATISCDGKCISHSCANVLENNTVNFYGNGWGNVADAWWTEYYCHCNDLVV